VQVEIWSDIVCPWCYIGKRRFEAALAQFEHADQVEVIYRSFELDPEAPAHLDGDRAERLAAKYGVTVERAREMEAHVTELAAGEGLAYDLPNAKSANSFDAHRLSHLAAEHGLQERMVERLMGAYFTEGLLISDHQTLVKLGVEVGIAKDVIETMLDSDWFTQAVREDEQSAQHFGISGVPTFIVDRQIGVSGAQPPEVLVQLLDEGWARASQAQALPQA
jgi:predicted DsbA family dithiol-disulfide isomerase